MNQQKKSMRVSEGLCKSQSHLAVTETSITITLLNTRSLKLQVLDIEMDDRNTEIQCEAGSDTSIIESVLQKKYTMHFKNSDNKFKSIPHGLSNDIEILAKEDFNGFSIFNIRKQNFCNNSFSTASINRCPNTQTSAFIDCLNYVVGGSIDILLGDFNIDTLDEVAHRRLKDTRSSYNLKVLETANLDGALLDHVYLHKAFEHDKFVMSVANNIYFSDHDALTVQLRFRQNSDNDIGFNIRV